MTVSSDAATRRTIDQVVLTAYQLAGLMGDQESTASTGWEGKSSKARILLDSILDELTVYGAEARMVTFYELTLTSGTFKYNMPSNVVNVIGDGAYIEASASSTEKFDGETVVELMSRDEWQTISGKGASGRPYKYYPHRGGTDYVVEVRLWPVPDEAGTVRFQVQRSPADAFDGDATLDLREFWMQYVYWELAHQLATSASLPVDRCSYLAKRARDKLEYARGFANEQTDNMFYLEHKTPWYGR